MSAVMSAPRAAFDRVAAEAGFGTATSMRQQLMAEIGVSPSAYRATFRAPTP